MDLQGHVRVQDSAGILIEDARESLDEAYSYAIPNGFLYGAPEGVHIGTGIESGLVQLTVSLLESMPALDLEEWEEVAEASTRFPTGEANITLVPDAADVFYGFETPTEWLRARLSARGRFLHPGEWDLGDSVFEHYRLQLWPSEPSPPTELTALLPR